MTNVKELLIEMNNKEGIGTKAFHVHELLQQCIQDSEAYKNIIVKDICFSKIQICSNRKIIDNWKKFIGIFPIKVEPNVENQQQQHVVEFLSPIMWYLSQFKNKTYTCDPGEHVWAYFYVHSALL